MIDLFVDHELSAELKQLGFNEECMAHWVKEGDNWNIYSSFNNFVGCQNSDGYLAAPIYQQAFDFLETIHILTGLEYEPHDEESLRRWIFYIKDDVLKSEAFIEGEWHEVEYVHRNTKKNLVEVGVRDDKQKIHRYYIEPRFVINNF